MHRRAPTLRTGTGTDTGTGVLQRYAKMASYSEGLSDAAGAPRCDNPYASVEARAPAASSVDSERQQVRDARTSLTTLDNARHLLLIGNDLRNNNAAAAADSDDVTGGRDDVIATDGSRPDGNANHFGSGAQAGAAEAGGGRVSPPRLRRREKATSSVVERQRPAGDVTDTSSSGHVIAAETSAAADDDESGYSTLRDILGQVDGTGSGRAGDDGAPAAAGAMCGGGGESRRQRRGHERRLSRHRPGAGRTLGPRLHADHS